MAKPSKRKWAVEKRERRILAQQDKARRVADRLLGRKIGIDLADGKSMGYSYTYKFRNSQTGVTTSPKI